MVGVIDFHAAYRRVSYLHSSTILGKTRMTKKLIMFGGAAGVLVFLAAAGGYSLGRRSNRYETKVAGEYLYKIDRHTGEVEFCFGVNCRPATRSDETPRPAKTEQTGEFQEAMEKARLANIEANRRCEFLLMLEEGLVTPDGKWTHRAQTMYQSEGQHDPSDRIFWRSKLVAKVRDKRLAAFGASSTTGFKLPPVKELEK